MTREDDMISRQAAIDYCYALINAENPSDPSDEWIYSQERISQTEVILHHLEFMPSAQPVDKDTNVPCNDTQPKNENEPIKQAQIAPDEDFISRKTAIDAIQGIGRLATLPDNDAVIRMSAVEYVLFNSPSAQPEPDEWCTDCKEYDHDRHCCPRWNRVIRETLKDAQPEIIRCRDCKHYIDNRCYNALASFHEWRKGEDFCSKAERRTDD